MQRLPQMAVHSRRQLYPPHPPNPHSRLHLSSSPAAVDAPPPRRQASGCAAWPSGSSVTSLITGRRAERALPSVARFVRRHAGDTYTVSFFVFGLQRRWNRISQLIFLSLGCRSWPSSLLIFPNILFSLDRPRYIFSHPWDSTQSPLLSSQA